MEGNDYMAGTKKIPMRLCIGCGNMKPKKELMRVLKTQDDSFVLDTTGRKNGRGAYVCRSAECLDMAIKSRGLERSFKCKIPADVYDSLRQMYE